MSTPGPTRPSNEPRASFGERGMAFSYPMSKGWAFVSSAPDHAWNAPGPDAVAFRTRGRFRIHILDNKNYASRTTASRASALTPRSLIRNLDPLIATIAQPRFDGVPRIQQLRTHLQGTRMALAGGKPLPKQVKLVVTNFGGKVGKVGPTLRRRGIVFRNINP
jgi:hypothetical protein